MSVRLDDLRSIRKALGKSQSKMAALLGVSTRAIQSYEQGWRSPPPAVVKLAAYLWYLHRRKELGKDTPPCWEVTGCSPEMRKGCFAFEVQEGRCCWMFASNPGNDDDSRRTALQRCAACPVMKRWLDS